MDQAPGPSTPTDDNIRPPKREDTLAQHQQPSPVVDDDVYADADAAELTKRAPPSSETITNERQTPQALGAYSRRYPPPTSFSNPARLLPPEGRNTEAVRDRHRDPYGSSRSRDAKPAKHVSG